MLYISVHEKNQAEQWEVKNLKPLKFKELPGIEFAAFQELDSKKWNITEQGFGLKVIEKDKITEAKTFITENAENIKNKLAQIKENPPKNMRKIPLINQEQEQKNKDLLKKCLYISNNKAVVRNKELLCVGDIINNTEYNNLYVGSDYEKNFGEVFINFDFIFMRTGRTIDKNSDIEYSLKNYLGFIFEDYKQYILKCLDNNQFINIAEIKLMELAGEGEERVKELTEYRENWYNRKEKEEQEKQIKREQEEKEYVDNKNKLMEESVSEAEQAILKKQEVKNVVITVYKSKYNSNDISLISYMMKQYNINVPLKTQGWINQALTSISYSEEWGDYSNYRYYKSSANSTVFYKYLEQLVKAIQKKYNKECA